MIIVVCVKQVVENRSQQLDRERATSYRQNACSIMNPADEHALEAALQIAEQRSAEVAVFTMGNAGAVAILRYAASLGVHQLFHVRDDALIGSDSLITAKVLARAISRLTDVGLILCGKKTIDSATSQVVGQMSVFLGMTAITEVSQIDLKPSGELVLVRCDVGLRQTICAKLPVVVSVDEGINRVRLPGITTSRQGKNLSIIPLTIQDLGFLPHEVGIVGSPTKVTKYYSVPLTHKTSDNKIGAEITHDMIWRLIKKNSVG